MNNKLDKLEVRMYNRYMLGKITLKELLTWHDTYLKTKQNKAA